MSCGADECGVSETGGRGVVLADSAMPPPTPPLKRMPGVPPRPDTGEVAFGFPPLMLMPGAPDSFRLPPVPTPLRPLGPSPARRFAPAFPSGEPPGTPGRSPSGDIEIRAARFPETIGRISVGGAGVIDNAISVCGSAADGASMGTSGAGTASPAALREPARGAAEAFSISFGLGTSMGVVAMFRSPAFFQDWAYRAMPRLRRAAWPFASAGAWPAHRG